MIRHDAPDLNNAAEKDLADLPGVGPARAETIVGGRSHPGGAVGQPFVSYTMPIGLSIVANTESTYDWQREQWTVRSSWG